MDFFNINTNANTNRLKKEKSKMELVDKIYNWMTKVKDSDPPKKFRAPKKVNRKKGKRTRGGKAESFTDRLKKRKKRLQSSLDYK